MRCPYNVQSKSTKSTASTPQTSPRLFSQTENTQEVKEFTLHFIKLKQQQKIPIKATLLIVIMLIILWRHSARLSIN